MVTRSDGSSPAAIDVVRHPGREGANTHAEWRNQRQQRSRHTPEAVNTQAATVEAEVLLVPRASPSSLSVELDGPARRLPQAGEHKGERSFGNGAAYRASPVRHDNPELDVPSRHELPYGPGDVTEIVEVRAHVPRRGREERGSAPARHESPRPELGKHAVELGGIDCFGIHDSQVGRARLEGRPLWPGKEIPAFSGVHRHQYSIDCLAHVMLPRR